MSTPFTPIETADLCWRSGIPVAKGFDDIYFSTESGLDETHHVFINGNNLLERWQSLSSTASTQFVIGELGFGSGLNFLLTWSLWMKHAPENATLHFISCEKHPLKKEDLEKSLALWPRLALEAEEFIQSYPVLTPGFHHLNFCHGRVKLTLMLGDALFCFSQLLQAGQSSIERLLHTKSVDAWYLDGFAPVKNPLMWQEDLLKVIALLSDDQTTLATFSAAGDVKRGLQSVGFQVEKKRGFGRKREMITARFKISDISLSKPYTPWSFSVPHRPKLKNAIILGGGLAGCFLARSLAERGWSITVIDGHELPGHGASGNTQAVLFPNFSRYHAPLTEYMLHAFQYAHRIYRNLLKKNQIMGELNGIIQLAYSEQEEIYQAGLASWFCHYPELGQLISAEEAAKLAGISVRSSGLYIPMAGWIDSQQLCEWLVKHERINWQGGLSIDSVSHNNHYWILDNFETETLVVANGYQANQFEQTAFLPLKPIRGQMTSIAVSCDSANLKLPLCANGHVLPPRNNAHLIGATYNLGSYDEKCREHDAYENIKKINNLPLDLQWSEEVITNWAGVRAATPDYLPFAGPVPIRQDFERLFAGLATNSKRWITQTMPCYPGLYIFAGFGSRGLTTIPLSAEWLAGLINNEATILPRRLVQAISPARFIRKDIIKKS